MKKQLLLFVAMVLPMVASAFDFNVGGIYYTITSISDRTVQVASGDSEYSGDIVIPNHVTYKDVDFLVNGIQSGWCIGSYGGYTELKFQGGAFTSSSITSVVIPSSITEIGDGTFAHCWSLKSVSLPSTLKKISGRGAFYGTSSLSEIILPDALETIGQEAFWESGITSLTIGSNIQSFGYCAFRYCYKLKVINIPSIAAWCQIANGDSRTNPLYYAKALTLNGKVITDIVIDSSIKQISNYSFYGYEGLNSITFDNGVSSIGDYAFKGCTELKELVFPEGLISIGSQAFDGCQSIKEIKFSSTINSIGSSAFNDCNNIERIESSMIEPTETSAFTNSTYMFTTLYVPVGTSSKYKNTSGWKNFSTIIEKENLGYYKYKLTYMVDGEEYKSYMVDYGATITPEPEPTKDGYTFSGWSEIPETMPAHDVVVTGTFSYNPLEPCLTPTISYNNGKLTFESETEGAVCQYIITDNDIKSGIANEIDLCVTYVISVYATKAGYENSETATATLCWIDASPKTGGITNGIANVPAKAVLIQTAGGEINVQGCEDDERISVYSINGSQVGAAISQNGAATVNTSLQQGNVAIVKIGQKSVKVVMK